MVKQFWRAGIIWGFLSEKMTLGNERENRLLFVWINWKCQNETHICIQHNKQSTFHCNLKSYDDFDYWCIYIYICFHFLYFAGFFVCLFVCFCFLFFIWFGSFWLWIFSWMKRFIWNYLVIIILRAMDCHDVSQICDS